MSLTDLKIALIFTLIFIMVFSMVIFTSAIFGLKSTYFILGLSSFLNACCLIFVLIANGKI